MLARIKEGLPVFTIGLILVGFFDLYFYYSLFGVEVYNYIDVSEIVFAFAFSYPAIVFICVFFFLMEAGLLMYDAEMISEKTIIKLMWINSGKGKILFLIVGYIGLILFLLVSIGMFFVPKVVPESFLSLLLILLLLSIYILLGVYVGLSPSHLVNDNNKRSTVLITLVILYLAFIVLKNGYKNHNVKNGLSSKVIELEFNSEQTFTSHSLIDSIKPVGNQFFFIGSTKHYYFFWNLNKKTTIVFPVNDIKKISIKEVRIKKSALKLLFKK